MSSLCNPFDEPFSWRRSHRRPCLRSTFHVFRGLKARLLTLKRSGMCYRKTLSAQSLPDLRILPIAYWRYFPTKCKVLQRGNSGPPNREAYFFTRTTPDLRETCTCFPHLVYVLDFCGKERFLPMAYLNRLFLCPLPDWSTVLTWSHRRRRISILARKLSTTQPN